MNKIFLVTSVAAAIAIGISTFFSLSMTHSTPEYQYTDFVEYDERDVFKK